MIHKTKKEEGKKHINMPLRWEFRIFRLDSRHISAFFGLFRHVSAVSSVSVTGRYELIWPIQPYSSRINSEMWISTVLARFKAYFSCFSRWSIRPNMADTARFGVNRSRVSANPRKKNKSPDAAPTRRQLRRTRVWHPPAAYMLSRFFQVLLLVVFWKVFFFNLNFH